jgi:hypothetical protein
MCSTRWGASLTVNPLLGSTHNPGRIDGALDPWIKILTTRLLDLFPLPLGDQVEPIPEPWPPRATLTADIGEDYKEGGDLLQSATGYYDMTVEQNSRITADDWYQDVRHFELHCGRDILCD